MERAKRDVRAENAAAHVEGGQAPWGHVGSMLVADYGRACGSTASVQHTSVAHESRGESDAPYSHAAPAHASHTAACDSAAPAAACGVAAAAQDSGFRVDFVGMLRGAGLLLAGCAAAALLFSASGCAASADADAQATTAEVLEENATEADDAEYASFEEVAAAFDASALDLDYSKRDMDAGYDESTACRITLSGGSAVVSGSGAAADGSAVTISAAGTYIVSGELSDGSLVVAAGDDDKVQIVLDGASISCSTGAAIDVQSADKCFITLADGSENELSDGVERADDTNACVYATCDLTINGQGSLSVSGNYRHGVFSKDDLVVYGGSIDVAAVEDGLHGKDSVKIGDGDISIEAGGDGVKATKDDKPTKGFVYVSGGALAIDAQDDGIQAKTYVDIAGGSIDIQAADDAIHSDLAAALDGGDVSVNCGDDAFHAETMLTINDGSFNAEACYEGYEAEQVIVNGGDTYICASDDALNASAADLSDESDEQDADASDALQEGSTLTGEPGANAVQPDGTVGSASSDGATQGDASDASASGDMAQDGLAGGRAGGAGQRGSMRSDDANGMGQPDGETPPELPNGDEQNSASGQMASGGTNEGFGGRGFADGAAGGIGGNVDSSNCLIQINGGTIVLDSQGDGVDSNGNVEVTGGLLLVNGPSSSGDGAFDYDGEATISGGTVIMAGSVGMAQAFTGGTQAFALVQTSGAAGSVIELADVDGNVLASLTATKAFGCVVVSGEGMADGDDLTVSVDGAATAATASTAGTSGISMGGVMGGRGGNGGRGGADGMVMS